MLLIGLLDNTKGKNTFFKDRRQKLQMQKDCMLCTVSFCEVQDLMYAEFGGAKLENLEDQIPPCNGK